MDPISYEVASNQETRCRKLLNFIVDRLADSFIDRTGQHAG